MENIDITDPNFALNESNSNSLFNYTFFNYTNPLWIYIGVFCFIFLTGLFFYNYYQRKKQTLNTNPEKKLDFPDDFSNMENETV